MSTKYDASNFCEDAVKIAAGSMLDRYIRELNETSYEDQKQAPNPTLLTIKDRQLVVFTAYLKQEQTTADFEHRSKQLEFA